MTPANDNDETITVAKLEWCLDRVALAMQKAGKDGDEYLPIYERLERELVSAKERKATMARARGRLKATPKW